MRSKRIGLSLLLFLVVFLGHSCFKNPEAPRWDTDITIPLIWDTYSMSELIDTLRVTSEYLELGSDSVLQFFIEQDFDTLTNIIDSIANFRQSTFTIPLVNFKIPKLTPDNLEPVRLSQVIPGGGTLPDTSVVLPVPPIDTTVTTRCPIMHDIRSIKIEKGILRIRLNNYTHVRFDSLVIQHLRTGDIDITIPFAPVEAMDSVSKTIAINNKWAADSIACSLHLRKLESEWTSVCKYDSIVVVVGFDSLNITGGEVKIPHLSHSMDTTLSLPTYSEYPIHLDSIEFSEGSITLRADNSFPVNAKIRIESPEFGLDTIFQVVSRQSNSMIMNLEGRSFHNYDPIGTSFRCAVQVNVDSSEDYVSFSVEDSIESDMRVDDLDFESIYGEFTDDIVHTIPTETRGIEIPEGLSSIRIKEAMANLTLTNAIGIRGCADLTVEGRNSKTGASANVLINAVVDAGEIDNPTTSFFSTNLAPVINIAPDTIILWGEITLPAESFSVKKASWITGHASVTTPLRLSFEENTVHFDPDTIKIDEDTRETLSHIRSGKLVVFLENRFPVGFDLDLVVEKGLPDPDTVIKRISITVAPVNIETGIATGPVLDTVRIDLSEDELNIFQYSPLTACYTLYVPKTDTIAFHINDYLKLGSYVTVRLKVGETEE